MSCPKGISMNASIVQSVARIFEQLRPLVKDTGDEKTILAYGSFMNTLGERRQQAIIEERRAETGEGL